MASTPLAYDYAAHSTSSEFGNTVYGLYVPAVVLSVETSYPASPSLQWVAWVSLPHHPGQVTFCQSVLCSAATANRPSWVASLFTIASHYLSLLLFLCVPFLARSLGSKLPACARALVLRQYPFSSGISRKETTGSPEFLSYPFRHMPRSLTPVVSCLLA